MGKFDVVGQFVFADWVAIVWLNAGGRGVLRVQFGLRTKQHRSVPPDGDRGLPANGRMKGEFLEPRGRLLGEPRIRGIYDFAFAHLT